MRRVPWTLLAAAVTMFSCERSESLSTPQHLVGGTVTGLAGIGLVLQNLGADDLPVNTNGGFAFATPITEGETYAVTVKTNSPSQTCAVSNGTGTVVSDDVTSVVVACTTNATLQHFVVGTVSGLAGSGFVLQNNGADDLLVNANGSFGFATPITEGESYAVTVKTQPSSPSQTCAVSNGTGTVGSADVTTVDVACINTPQHFIGGSVSGLAGSGLVLRNNGAEDLPVGANGTFAFATPIPEGGAYAVTVKIQPNSPAQTCTVSNATGTVGGGDVTSVAVACSNVSAGTITEFAIPTVNSTPDGIVAGPDGNIWFTEHGYTANKIGRITPAGIVTEFATPTAMSQPSGIAVGPDGNLWFTEGSGTKIGRITAGGVVTEFTVPTLVSQPTGIVAGPDGNLWFTEDGGSKIGRITTTGVVTEFDIPTRWSHPLSITTDPDGNLWFTEYGPNQIGRITTTGVVTEFAIPTYGCAPEGITLGPDGNLWFTEFYGNQIGRITPTGVVTEFMIPTGGSYPNNSGPSGITVGPDGNLWFTEYNANQIGRITPAGVITEFTIPTSSSGPRAIATGPDGSLWFTEYDANQIGRIVP